jgi:anti-sigma-K factor RskA
MNLEEYLSSGIIEDYCLGVLNPDEMQKVARNAEQYEEIKDAIETYELALKRYVEDLEGDNEIDIKKDDILFNLLKRMKK